MSGSRHEELRKVGREYLKANFGFEEDEIFEEYAVERGNKSWKIDVAGVRKEFKVAVEVGNVSIFKVLALSSYVDRVVWIPYWLTTVTGEEGLNDRVDAKARALAKEMEKAKEATSIGTLQKAQSRANSLQELLDKILFLIFTRVEDNSLKGEIGQMLEGHGFDTHQFGVSTHRPERG